MREFPVLLIGKRVQETGRDRTIKDEISLEEFDTFEGFVTTGLTSRRFAATDVGTFVVGGRVHVWTVWVIFDIWILISHGSIIIVIDTKLSDCARRKGVYVDVPVSPSKPS